MTIETPPGDGMPDPAAEREQRRFLARSLLITSRLYRFFALAFAVVGTVVFFYLYFRNIHGQLFEAMKSPMVIGMVLLPFLPAAVLSILAQRTERQFIKLLKPESDPLSAPAEKA